MRISIFIYFTFLECFQSFTINRATCHLAGLSNNVRRCFLNAPLKFSKYEVNENADFNINEKDQESEEDEIDEEQLISRLNQEIMAEMGVELDQLINPSKVVNLERDLIKLEKQRLKTSDTKELQTIDESILKKKGLQASERRAVMRGWLKQLFVFQSVVAIVASLGMVYNAIPGYDLPLPLQVLGFWMWWLFIIPSLRGD